MGPCLSYHRESYHETLSRLTYGVTGSGSHLHPRDPAPDTDTDFSRKGQLQNYEDRHVNGIHPCAQVRGVCVGAVD